MMATISMDSIQFYQPPLMTPLFSGKYTASPHIDPEPPVAPRYKKGSQVLESASSTVVDRRGDFGSQHDSGRDQDAVNEDEDDLPTIKELLRRTLRKEDLIEEPEDRERTLQRADQRGRSRLLDAGDSQGGCINSTMPQTKQLVTIYREASYS
jgi:hypothetical protein